MGQVSAQTSQPIVGRTSQQPANPTQTSKILTFQDTDQKGEKKKQRKIQLLVLG